MRNLAILIGIGIAVTTSCWAQERSHYIRDSGPASPVIIFLHGVMGDSKSTWTSDGSNAYWPDLLKQDGAFSGASIYVYEYRTDLSGGVSNLNINELATQLKHRLDDAGVMQHGRLVFIAHSMGGLLARDLLLTYREMADKTKFIFFLATPTTGAGIANFAKWVSGDPNFQIVAKSMKRYEYLAEKQRDWVNAELGAKIDSYCAYETKETGRGPFKMLVVDETSATYLCEHGVVAIQADHYEIAKPAAQSADQYVEFRNYFKREMLSNKLDLVNRGAEYLAKKENESALKDFNEAILLDPEYVPALKNRGAIYLNTGEFGRAVQDYKEAIRLEPDNGEHFYNRGAAYSGIGNYELAISDYTEAIRLNFYNKAVALYYRGVAKQNKGDLAGGDADKAAARAIDPDVGN